MTYLFLSARTAPDFSAINWIVNCSCAGKQSVQEIPLPNGCSLNVFQLAEEKGLGNQRVWWGFHARRGVFSPSREAGLR